MSPIGRVADRGVIERHSQHKAASMSAPSLISYWRSGIHL